MLVWGSISLNYETEVEQVGSRLVDGSADSYYVVGMNSVGTVENCEHDIIHALKKVLAG